MTTPPPLVSRRQFASALTRSALAWAVCVPGCHLGRGSRMIARLDPSGQVDVLEAARPVLRYLYRKVEPGGLLSQIAESNRKYAVARSNYIHPLYGPNGEELTRDWSIDHPHHRGVYWAWPEVDWRGQRGDLHALQKVFARPTGRLALRSGNRFAEIDAENLWVWEDGTAIVRERAHLRAWAATPTGRAVDLRFDITALDEPVSLARRGTNLYGGLNLRLNAVRNQVLTKHTDPPTAVRPMAWSDLSGIFPGAPAPSGVAVFQHPENPDYPGDWVEYPELNWLQPTFPAAGRRFELRPSRPLVLRYRIWIHPGGPLGEADARKEISRLVIR